MKSSFWIYWAITIPLTTIVLVAYLTYIVRIQRRDRLEDLIIVRRLNEENKGRSTHAVHDTIRKRKGGASSFDLSRSRIPVDREERWNDSMSRRRID